MLQENSASFLNVAKYILYSSVQVLFVAQNGNLAPKWRKAVFDLPNQHVLWTSSITEATYCAWLQFTWCKQLVLQNKESVTWTLLIVNQGSLLVCQIIVPSPAVWAESSKPSLNTDRNPNYPPAGPPSPGCCHV